MVATLTVKNLPDPLYQKLQARARREHRSVAEAATGILAAALDHQAPLSILDLEGLGRDLWSGIDPAAHVSTERAAWD